MTEIKTTPLVSVIVNCFNGDKFLRETLDSIFRQSYSNFEVIFWDNQSTDESKEIAQSYDSRLKYFLAPLHTCLGEARANAIDKARGDYICFLDTDDLFAKDRLTEQVSFMEKNKIKFSFGSYVEIDSHSIEKKRHIVQEYFGYMLEAQLHKYTICMHTVMIAKELLDQSWCYFDMSLKHSPDTNLFLKILANYPAGAMQKVLAFYRIHDAQQSKIMLSRVGIEFKYTLDELIRLFPEVTNAILPTFEWAYSKVHFYNAIGHISQRNYHAARQSIAPIISLSIYYKILYLLIVLRIPAPVILRLLSR